MNGKPDKKEINRTTFVYSPRPPSSENTSDSDFDKELIAFKKKERSSECPHPGLQYLHDTSAIYIKPSGGPRVVGHLTSSNQYELLNAEGKRIFFIVNNFPREGSKIYLSNEYENEEFRKCPMHLSVLNHLGEEVFLLYGRHGKMLIVGPYDTPPWGKVIRKWDSWFHCTWSGPLSYEVRIEKTTAHKQKTPEKVAAYLIDGRKQSSLCPSESSKKVYFSTFDCKIFPERFLKAPNQFGEVAEYGDPIGQVSSSLACATLGYTLPGIIFPEDLNVYHKAVIIGVLLIDIIRK